MDTQRIPIVIETDSLTCICVIAAIQLATRHRKYVGPSRQVTEDFAKKLQQIIAAAHPEFATIIEMGWNPNFDISEQ